MIPAVIVHFNTPKLTEGLCYSLFKNGFSKIYVFDNSDKEKFCFVDKRIDYIDNTSSAIINFDSIIESDKVRGLENISINNYGSAKHTITVDHIIKTINEDEIILFDADTLLKKQVDFIDNSCATIGFDFCGQFKPKRIAPFIQYFNLKIIRDNNISFYDKKRMLTISTNEAYDTGASFFEDVLNNNLKFKRIDYREYVEHFGGASYKGLDTNDWLNKNKKYYSYEHYL